MFNSDEIIKATNAILSGNIPDGDFTISTDTRTIKKGEIYLPLKGENFDGENFINKAVENGAAAAFCTKEHTDINIPLLKVDNTLDAYLKLAEYYKNKIAPKVIAITGSSGKTTTKEMTYAVCNKKFKTHKTEKNYNNEVGFCKTILSMPEDTQVLILEMGMRGLGEIELLAKHANPDIAIIANIGTAHIGRLGSRENIAKAKCEIFSNLKKDGLLIAHDDVLIKNSAKNINSEYFSLDKVKIIERKIGFTKFIYKNFEYELFTEGDHNVQNSLAAIETGLALKMKEKDIAQGLKNYKPIEKRWEIENIKGINFINDSYNANPDSMKAVIKTILDNDYKNITFILGDMGELGKNEIQYHKDIGNFIVSMDRKDIKVLTVGKLSAEITKILKDNNIFSENFNDNIQISKYILDNASLGNTIVLKASRAMKFEEITDFIKQN